MTMKGWIMIRRLPKVEGEGRQSQLIRDLIKNHLEKFDLCGQCKGEGELRNHTGENRNLQFKIADMPEISNYDANKTDLIRNIVMRYAGTPRECPTCHGEGWLNKSGQAQHGQDNWFKKAA